ncbi:MAG: hypothetical protein Q4A92_09875 [Corynebacterium sp.]|nr:hypothetical protein [Corynebacterium sp.]
MSARPLSDPDPSSLYHFSGGSPQDPDLLDSGSVRSSMWRPRGIPRGFLACTFTACVMAGSLGACAPGFTSNTNSSITNSTQSSSGSTQQHGGQSSSPNSSGTSSNTSGATSGSQSSEETSHAGLSPLGDTSLDSHKQEAHQGSSVVITSVRAASHDGFDRIVFETTGPGTPGWIVDYIDNPSQQTSGEPIEVPGDTALEVNVTGTTYPFELGIDNPSIGRTELNTVLVTDIVDGGTFEAQSQFIVGIKGGRKPYSVQMLENPTRVVVDVLHE